MRMVSTLRCNANVSGATAPMPEVSAVKTATTMTVFAAAVVVKSIRSH